MKRSIVFPAIVLVVGLASLSMGQQARAAGLKCTGADGKSDCSAAQITDLNTGLASGKRMHKPLLMDVDSIAAGPKGTLICRKAGGGMCTDDQIDAIVALAADTKSTSTPFHVVKTQDSASPALFQH